MTNQYLLALWDYDEPTISGPYDDETLENRVKELHDKDVRQVISISIDKEGRPCCGIEEDPR